MSSAAKRSTLSADPNLLAPQHAYTYSSSRERSTHRASVTGLYTNGGVDSLGSLGPSKGNASSKTRERRSRGRSRTSRRGESRQWKKLLWIKQPYPDNYTDASTFLSHLQVNPRLQIYDFWPLVADSTVIVQHICAVAIFVCCFIGIYQERIMPVSVVSTATGCSFAGWILWDFWLGSDEKEKAQNPKVAAGINTDGAYAVTNGTGPDGLPNIPRSSVPAESLGIGESSSSHMAGSVNSGRHNSRSQSASSLPTTASNFSGAPNVPMAGMALPSHAQQPPFVPSPGLLSSRNQQRLATAKSAFLIYLALLGLSPILKSLTLSTSSDSIWAMSCWLLLTNIFTFDYGGSESPSSRFPASLSTNAALMASTVLASRLPTTTHVFSLTLFSIEVFGLFPVFRRHLRHRSFLGHAIITSLLILISGAGLGMTLISGSVVRAAITGMVVWGLGTMISMGGCSWWLIGLQRYKNVVIGPWDPARPIIRAGV